jgi:hypothetical protein
VIAARRRAGPPGVSGGSAGAHDLPDTTAIALRAAVVALASIALERKREVHGLAGIGPVETPVGRQALDQHQAPSRLRVGRRILRHRHGARRVVDIDAQLAAGADDDEQDSLAPLVRDGIGHQFAGEQDRDGRVDGDIPGTDGLPDLAAGFGRRGRSRG